MPVFKNPAGYQPEIIFGIGRFGRRLIRRCNDLRATVRVAIELDTFALLDIGIETFAVAPERFRPRPQPVEEPAPSFMDRIGEFWWAFVVAGVLLVLSVIMVFLKRRREAAGGGRRSVKRLRCKTRDL